MIIIENVEISKNPVNTGEVFIISILLEEIMATFYDLSQVTWDNVDYKTWDQVKRKYF